MYSSWECGCDSFHLGVLAERPQLALAHAWVAGLTGQPVEAERRLREAAALGSPSDLPADVRAVVALLRSNIGLSGLDPSVTEAYAHEALEHMPVDHVPLRYMARGGGAQYRHRGSAALGYGHRSSCARRGRPAGPGKPQPLSGPGGAGHPRAYPASMWAAQRVLHTGERTLAIGAEYQIVPLAAGIALSA